MPILAGQARQEVGALAPAPPLSVRHQVVCVRGNSLSIAGGIKEVLVRRLTSRPVLAGQAWRGVEALAPAPLYDVRHQVACVWGNSLLTAEGKSASHPLPGTQQAKTLQSMPRCLPPGSLLFGKSKEVERSPQQPHPCRTR